MSNDKLQNIDTQDSLDSVGAKESMIIVDHVSMIFNMANERIQSLKEYFIKAVRRELMFKEFIAIDDVSFTVERGDVFGLVGSNGSGKSTMLKIIAGVLEPTKGSCTIKGSIAPLIELGAGFDMELSARENIYLNGALLGYSKQFIEEHFDSIVEFAEVGDFLEMPMKNYSSGMVARIAFAIATETVPDILIVDEVLSVGDFMFQKKCEKRITSLIEDHGVTVLIVSHDSKLIERLCNRAIWIEKGHTKAIGDAKEICDLYRVLGGNSNDPRSQELVRKIFDSNVEIDPRRIHTISAEDRYHAAAKICKMATGFAKSEYVVLASGENPNTCFIANSLSGLLECPMLLVKNDSVPSVTLDALSAIKPKRTIIVSEKNDIEEQVLKQVRAEIGYEVNLVTGNSLSSVSLNTFLFGSELGFMWSKTAAVTHKDCVADHNAFSLYTYSNKVPVFFNIGPGTIDDHVEEILSASMNELLIIGGFISYPEECIRKIVSNNPSIITERFYAENGYEASILIAKWIIARNQNISLSNIFISSVWSPEDTLAIGQFASKEKNIILMEDPQELDSVVSTFDFLLDHKTEIDTLTFIGNNDQYEELDKELLVKALVIPDASSTQDQ